VLLEKIHGAREFPLKKSSKEQLILERLSGLLLRKVFHSIKVGGIRKTTPASSLRTEPSLFDGLEPARRAESQSTAVLSVTLLNFRAMSTTERCNMRTRVCRIGSQVKPNIRATTCLQSAQVQAAWLIFDSVNS
jgi:hypothetical protein